MVDENEYNVCILYSYDMRCGLWMWKRTIFKHLMEKQRNEKIKQQPTTDDRAPWLILLLLN